MKLPPYKLIKTGHDWRVCLERLGAEPRIAVDLEANSLYAYRERVCLIQISIPTKDYIIDPLAPLDLSELGAILENPEIEKIFHAAEYDLILMKRQYGWTLKNLFDTMWAARILGYERCGLASLLESFYGVRLNKRYQKANWSRRPLPHNQLRYAQMDTFFLLSLRDRLDSELAVADRAKEAQEIFAEQSQIRLNSNKFDPDGFWSINGVRDLEPWQHAVVKALYVYRDQQARRQDRPPFKVFDDRTIMQLATVVPNNMSQLRSIHGMSKGQIRRYGRDLIRVMEEAQKGPTPQRPKHNGRQASDVVLARYERLHDWRKNRAQARGVESDVILCRETLWDLARENPKSFSDLCQIQSLGSWRRESYGDEILQVLDND